MCAWVFHNGTEWKEKLSGECWSKTWTSATFNYYIYVRILLSTASLDKVVR